MINLSVHIKVTACSSRTYELIITCCWNNHIKFYEVNFASYMLNLILQSKSVNGLIRLENVLNLYLCNYWVLQNHSIFLRDTVCSHPQHLHLWLSKRFQLDMAQGFRCPEGNNGLRDKYRHTIPRLDSGGWHCYCRSGRHHTSLMVL